MLKCSSQRGHGRAEDTGFGDVEAQSKFRVALVGMVELFLLVDIDTFVVQLELFFKALNHQNMQLEEQCSNQVEPSKIVKFSYT